MLPSFQEDGLNAYCFPLSYDLEGGEVCAKPAIDGVLMHGSTSASPTCSGPLEGTRRDPRRFVLLTNVRVGAIIYCVFEVNGVSKGCYRRGDVSKELKKAETVATTLEPRGSGLMQNKLPTRRSTGRRPFVSSHILHTEGDHKTSIVHGDREEKNLLPRETYLLKPRLYCNNGSHPIPQQIRGWVLW